MSLINDALKKAQRERTGESPTTTPPTTPPPKVAPPPPVTPVANAAASGGFKAWPLVIAVLVIVVGFVAWRGMSPPEDEAPVTVSSESRSVQTPAAAAPPPDHSVPGPEISKLVESLPAPKQEVVLTAPVIEPKAADSQPPIIADSTPVAAPVQAPPVVADPVRIEPKQQAIVVNIPSATDEKPSTALTLPATVITIPESTPSSSPAAPLVSVRQQDPRILAYLDALRVNGIRPSPDDPKVLMNNRVFRIGDVVDRELNLRLAAIAPNKLTFEDDRGMAYLKSF